MNAATRVVLVLAFLTIADAVRGADGEKDSLAKAVAQLNKNVAQKSSIGRAEPPLTEDEVVAAIRAINRKQWPMDERTYEEYQKIAETRRLPSTAKFSCLSGAIVGDYEFVMWRIDLHMNFDSKREYRYPLRTRMIRSARINEHSDRLRAIGQ